MPNLVDVKEVIRRLQEESKTRFVNSFSTLSQEDAEANHDAAVFSTAAILLEECEMMFASLIILRYRLRALLDQQVIVDAQGKEEAARCEKALLVTRSELLKTMEEWKEKADKWDALGSSEGVS